MPLSGYDVILGMPWLEEISPHIQWRQKKIHFHHAGKHHHIESAWSINVVTASEIKLAARREQLEAAFLGHASLEAGDSSVWDLHAVHAKDSLLIPMVQ